MEFCCERNDKDKIPEVGQIDIKSDTGSRSLEKKMCESILHWKRDRSVRESAEGTVSESLSFQ